MDLIIGHPHPGTLEGLSKDEKKYVLSTYCEPDSALWMLTHLIITDSTK